LNLSVLKPGRSVLVIGAGNTAIDCATIAKRLGSARVTMIYRRTDAQMTAYEHEYSFVKNEGVGFEFLTQPMRVMTAGGQVTGLECARTELMPEPRPIEGSTFVLAADQIVKAIGQKRPSIAEMMGLKTERGLIQVDGEFRTSLPRVFAGGDCIRYKGSASTVMAAQDGKLAAAAIHNEVSRNG
jgi:glutamate synthase (NADPH/NADH) small chain